MAIVDYVGTRDARSAQAVDLDAKAGVTAARLDHVDGLRALAALWVALHHAIETSEPRQLMGLPVLGWALKSLFFGQFPVMVFLLLSGFCLYYPCVKRAPDAPALSTGFGAYLQRRATRLMPPYLAAGVLCMLLLAIPGLQIGRWQTAGPVSPAVVLSHLLLVHNLIPAHATKIDYPMWSIGLEWQLYLVFPLLVLGFRRWGGVIVAAACLALAVVIRVTYRNLPEAASAALRDGPLSYLEIFALGMIAAQLAVRGTLVAPRWVLGAVAVMAALTIRLGSGNGLVHDLAASAAAFCLLNLCTEAGGKVSRALRTRWLVQVGLFSYSLYLVHAPLLHLAWMILRSCNLSADITFGALILLGMPAVLALAYLFHRLFERPFMRIR